MVKVFSNRCWGYQDADGFVLTIKAPRHPMFEGSMAAAADFLESAVPVGASVEVRSPDWVRSCMNKPALWADMRARNVEKE